MTMKPAVRRLALTAHVTVSVGWIGAALVFLAIAVVALTAGDDLTVRGAYVLMERAGWLVLVPLAFASLLTGVVMSLGTTWGLFWHYWVVVKLVITVFSTIILLIYTGTFRQMAHVAANPNVALDGVRNPSPLLHAILAIVLLLTASVLAVYKPVGVTAYGRRKQLEEGRGPTPTSIPQRSAAPTNASPWLYVSVAVAVVIVVILLVVILHLMGTVGGRH